MQHDQFQPGWQQTFFVFSTESSAVKNEFQPMSKGTRDASGC
jgi:hypothetical protein